MAGVSVFDLKSRSQGGLRHFVNHLILHFVDPAGQARCLSYIGGSSSYLKAIITTVTRYWELSGQEATISFGICVRECGCDSALKADRKLPCDAPKEIKPGSPSASVSRLLPMAKSCAAGLENATCFKGRTPSAGVRCGRPRWLTPPTLIVLNRICPSVTRRSAVPNLLQQANGGERSLIGPT